MPINNIYQSQEARKSRAKPEFSSPSPAVKIRRRSQHQDALDTLTVNMLEVAGVAGQHIVGPGMNRSQQDWLVLRVVPDGLWQFETLRCSDGRDGLQ